MAAVVNTKAVPVLVRVQERRGLSVTCEGRVVSITRNAGHFPVVRPPAEGDGESRLRRRSRIGERSSCRSVFPGFETLVGRSDDRNGVGVCNWRTGVIGCFGLGITAPYAIY